MNYYNEIKNELVNNEIYKKAKDYSKNKSDLTTYYNVGKLIVEAQGGETKAQYGNQLIKEYSLRLTVELGKGYSWRNLYNMRAYYIKFFHNEILQPLATKLSWTHISILISLNDINAIMYYANETIKNNIGKRELQTKIKSKEYERLDEETKLKIINKEKLEIKDLIKNPIVIKNKYDTTLVSEKMLKQLILEDIEAFMKELGSGYTFVGSEYKIKIGNAYNYIDILLFNYIYNAFVVIELKVTELKKEYIGQIEIYMNYIDENIKTINQDKTIGVIICRENNEFIIKYTSDKRIISKEFVLS